VDENSGQPQLVTRAFEGRFLDNCHCLNSETECL
jgi:hypothetical protein